MLDVKLNLSFFNIYELTIPEENKGLDLEEKYALRYAAGYALKKKVKVTP